MSIAMTTTGITIFEIEDCEKVAGILKEIQLKAEIKQ